MQYSDLMMDNYRKDQILSKDNAANCYSIRNVDGIALFPVDENDRKRFPCRPIIYYKSRVCVFV